MADAKKTTTKKAAPASEAPAKKKEAAAKKDAPAKKQEEAVTTAAPESAAPAAAADAEGAEAAAAAPKRRKRNARHVPDGRAYIQATYNNTIITLTDPNGKVLTWGSAGTSGFKGTRKATPYAASMAAEAVVRAGKNFGLERVHVYLSGVGSGREQSVRSLQANGLQVLSITDTTPIAHNGVRRPRVRRV